METIPPDIEILLAKTIRSNKRIARCLTALFAIWVFTVADFMWISGRQIVHANATAQDTILKVRGVEIIDEHGTTRIRIGAPLPEPIIMGKVGKRDDSVSGVMLYDALGNERGGYVTDNSVGNAFLTLDSNLGQEVTLVAYPQGGAELGINDDKKDQVAMSALQSGPRFRLRRHGSTLVDLPATVPPSADK